MKRNTRIALGVCLLSGFILTVPANADLLTNGNFATGDFTGWNAQTQSGSNGTIAVLANNNTIAPTAGGQPTVGGPASGDNYAVTGQTGPGAYSLSQAFTVGAAAQDVSISFLLFVNDYAADGVIDGPLDYTGNPDEHATVDLLTGTADAFSTAPADVIQNFYSGADNLAGNPNPYTTYTFDITGDVVPGGTYQIRFGEVDNVGLFNMGVADVSVSETDSPEPATFLLLIPAGIGMAAFRRRLAR